MKVLEKIKSFFELEPSLEQLAVVLASDVRIAILETLSESTNKEVSEDGN